MMQRSSWSILVIALALTVIPAGCRKPEKPKSEKKKYAEAVLKRSQEQMAVNEFATALRAILQWRETQENVQNDTQRQFMIKQLAEKMNQVPVEGLPLELLDAWEQMLKAWRTLDSNRDSASLHESGAVAAKKLNAQLEAHGVLDIRF